MSVKQKITIILTMGVFMLSSCSTPLVPAPRMPRESRSELSDATVMADLRRDWKKLQQVHMSPEERQAVIASYNAKLLLLLRRIRHDIMSAQKGGASRSLSDFFTIAHEGVPKNRHLNDIYDDIVPAKDICTEELKEHYIVPGLGVPLVGIIPAEKIREGDHLMPFHARGTVSTLTALMEFPDHESGRPVLQLIPRHWNERVQVGKLSYPLAGDFSAPIEVYWNLTRIKKGRFLGLLHPQKLRDTTGLSSMERYNPDKIPVILAHGLASSADTFNNLVNRLLSDPEVRHNYQFWYFNYPTGIAWSISAAEYRKSLEHVRNHFDPRRKNRNWDNMVVVGHSMGGLITHLNQTVSTRGQEAKYLPGKLAPNSPLLKQLYDFQPVRAGQVIYMATPHRGAPIAKNRFVLFLTRLVELPQTLVQEAFSLATLQEDNALTNPRRLTEWFTSIGQLSPDSYSIRELAHVPVQDVPTHSVIGDRGKRNSPRSTDGIVPYWSSHLPWGTETIVPTDHHVQDIPETALDVTHLLHEHLKRPGIRPAASRKSHSH